MQSLKSYSKRVLAGFLSIVFFANITFAHSVDFHMCQGELQSVAFFGEKASCDKMIEAQMTAPLSCCDLKKEFSGLSFKQKSCCDNVQLIQDNLLHKSSLDFDQTNLVSLNFTSDFKEVGIELSQLEPAIQKVEIPPPPNIRYQHTQEHLQVFTI